MARRIRILSDGKPGHVNQSIGLAQAIARRIDATIDIVSITQTFFPHRLVTAAATDAFPHPDLIIAAGHRTHLPLLWAAQQSKAKTVVIMKPSLPSSLFDHVIIPAHDRIKGKNIISSEGSLNKITEDLPVKENKGLIMIGGESKHTDWNPKTLLEAVVHIVTQTPQLEWSLTDSRRTPEGFLDEIRELNLPLSVHPSTETGPEWLPNQLALSRQAWVTPDSSSMIYEALTANVTVGLLPLPQLDTKVTRGIRDLIRQKRITYYSQDQSLDSTISPSETFHEAARCAEILLEKGLFHKG